MVRIMKSECLECGSLGECLEKGGCRHLTENDRLITGEDTVNLLKAERKGNWKTLIIDILGGR